ncbi:MAG: hypothetical protein ACREBG_27105 [Pyrinomonadaceae bacterium]
MKHIEFSSEPWNPSPSKYGTLFESAVAVLKSSLGTSWGVTLLAILTIVVLPIPVFYLLNKIQFDPASFVTEWLKLTVEGIIFFFILEIVRHRSLSFTARQLLITFVATNYIIPLQGMIESLRHFHDGLLGNASFEPIPTITSVRHHWNVVKYALSDSALANLPVGGELIVWRKTIAVLSMFVVVTRS